MGYGVVAWLAVQVTDVMAPVLFLPEWSVRLVLTLALIGLPVALVIAWSLDGSPDAKLARQRVRGLAGRIVDFAIIGVLAGLAAALLINDHGFRGSASEGIDSIAVMPFRDLSEQGTQAYLGDGLAGELLNQLARVDGLRVAARTSSFAFRGSNVDIREIGRHLEVDAVVEGSLRVSDRQIRITVQLIGIEDGFNIWSRTYTRHMDDILALQEEIGASIVDALRLEILGGDAGAGQTRSSEAYQKYLEGRFEFHRRTPESLARARGFFREAIRLDPDYALAYTGLADTGLLLVGYGNLSPAEGQAIAEEAVARALALDNRLAEAYASLGLLRHQSGDAAAAEQAYRHAIELNPGYAMAHMWLGNLMMDAGRLQQSRHAYRNARALDPLHPVISANLASGLFMTGEFEEGMAVLRQAAEFAPQSDTLRRQMAAWAGKYGHLAEAMSYARQALRIAPEAPANLLAMSVAAQGLGQVRLAEQWLERAEVVAPDNYMVILRRAEMLEQTGRMVALDAFAAERLQASPVEPGAPLTEADRMHLTWAGVASIHLHNYDEGIALLERALENTSPPRARFELPTMTQLVIAYRKSARDADAERVLNDCWRITENLRAQGMDDPAFRARVAGLYAIAGDDEQALALLEDASRMGWRDFGTVENSLGFAGLRRNHGFRDLMQRLRNEVSAQRSIDSGVAASTDSETPVPENALVRSRDGATMRLNAK